MNDLKGKRWIPFDFGSLKIENFPNKISISEGIYCEWSVYLETLDKYLSIFLLNSCK